MSNNSFSSSSTKSPYPLSPLRGHGTWRWGEGHGDIRVKRSSWDKMPCPYGGLGARGSNCARFVNGECMSKMSSGERWQVHNDQAAACPPEWDFGTRFRTPDGREWVCLDRGGAIRCGYTPYWMEYDGLAWADLLTSTPGFSFRQVAEIEFLD
jgi:hypothetical protein